MHPEFTPKWIERFWSRVDQSGGPDACWPWTMARTPDGYGVTCVKKRLVYAHRVVVWLRGEDFAPGEIARHRCNFPPCCNPRHIVRGTYVDNMLDSVEAGNRTLGKTPYAPHGDPRHMCKVTEDDVRVIRERLAAGERRSAIAKDYGLHRHTIRSIAIGRTWKHVK